MTMLFALAVIHRAPKQGPSSELKGYDADGNAIVRAAVEQIQPRAIFEETDEAEAQWLIDNNGAREATATEIELHSRQSGQ